jgi:PhzF family phenazine biosynthesis protein
MQIPLYQVDAFTSDVFGGNPAAVCPLEYWLEDKLLQKIAQENNLSETAFFVDRGEFYQIRWFTPQIEVDLCGHATLASAFVIMNSLNSSLNDIVFGSARGELKVSRNDDMYSLDFPAHIPVACEAPENLLRAMDIIPEKVLASDYYMVVYKSESDIRQLNPYMKLLKELDRMGVIVTAPGENVDFVSRFFAPAVGIPEDPVTGSAHCTLIPYWSKVLNKKKLHAYQVSERGGEIFGIDKGDRVTITGKAVQYLEGTITI